MADRIKLLPEYVANQIAAGEVVNRPSSVVKELLENAVDAGSKNITINCRDGGKTLIHVIDDGCGMSPADARLAFDRHATSKIKDINDIYALSTFGFRGEALASIASVAEVELRTRQADSELGTKIEISGGSIIAESVVNCSVGSQFLIRNLFYNVPVRRRFLEKSTTETRHIIAEYQRVALCNPEISFTLYDNDTLLSKLPAAPLRQRIVSLMGKNIAKNLLDVHTETSIVGIKGFTGRPSSAKQNNKEQFLFINGRFFKSPYFHKAVLNAYEKLIPQNSQPSYFLFLTIDPEKIDVNVHPQKTEVKFEDGPAIWQIINAAIRETLAKSGAVPSMDFDMDTSIEIPVYKENTSYKIPQIKANPDFNPFHKDDEVQHYSRHDNSIDISDFTNTYDRSTGAGGAEKLRDSMFADIPDAEEAMLNNISEEGYLQANLDIISMPLQPDILRLGTKYAVAIHNGNLIIVDIRRAFEAVLFDRYIMMISNGNSASQQLLFPDIIPMSNDDISLLKEHLPDITSFGFDIRQGKEEFIIEVHGIPADISIQRSDEFLYDLLDALRGDTETTESFRKRRIAEVMSVSCSRVKASEIDDSGILNLLASLAVCDNPSFTPSGMPVFFTMSEDEVQKRLKK